MEAIKKFRMQTRKEEYGNIITHAVGTCLAIVGTYLLISKALFSQHFSNILSACIFGSSLIILYLMSTLYHSATNEKTKKILQAFDHCSIFILILGSYAPFCLVTLKGITGYMLFTLNSALTLIGLTVNIINVKKYHKLSLILYIVMGWSIMLVIKPAITSIPSNGLWMLVLGGLSYTLGIIFYKAKNMMYSHVIWHLFVLAGSILHFFCIYLYVV